MEKRTMIKNIAYAAVLLSCLIISSCGGSNTYTDSYAEPSTTTTTTTGTTNTSTGASAGLALAGLALAGAAIVVSKKR